MPVAKTTEEAMAIVSKHVGNAVVRVGVTQYPAGIGLNEVAELTPDIVDACNNIRMGTRLFAKVYRIVVKWYGSEPPEALDDAIHLWMGGILRRQIGHSGAGHSKARGRRAEY